MKLTTVLDKGYQVITLSSYGLQTRRYVHDLVLEAFTGPRPDGMEGCHNDGVPANNVHSNLRWDTHQGNNADKKLHGTAQIGTLHWKCVYTADQIRECKRLSATGLDATEVSRITGVKVSTVAQVKAGRHWAHI